MLPGFVARDVVIAVLTIVASLARFAASCALRPLVVLAAAATVYSPAGQILVRAVCAVLVVLLVGVGCHRAATVIQARDQLEADWR